MSDDAVDLVVLGGGPGGYTAAFRAADLGLRTMLVEREDRLGGVCMNVGCIPSKALLHAASIITEAAAAGDIGIAYGPPSIDLDKLRSSTLAVVGRLAKGLSGLADKRAVEVVRGTGRFAGSDSIALTTPEGVRTVRFRNAIIAVGSRPAMIPGLPDDPRIMDSTGALALADVPHHLVVVGGGIIGLEMATVYHALGSRVTVVELLPDLMSGCDRDLVRPLQKRLSDAGVEIHLETKVTAVDASGTTLRLALDGPDGATTLEAERVLVSIGRLPNGGEVDAGAAGVTVDERGYIAIDDAMRTNVPNIYAVGDVVGNPMLAHKASHQGRVAAENAAGGDEVFDAKTIPSVAYTDPEVAWMGLTETQAKADGIPYEVAAIPWGASGRAMTMGRTEGRTKILVDPVSRRIIGGGIVGVGAGELIAELVVAFELGATAEDVALAIHPHPSLSETPALASEWAEGTVTDLYRAPTTRTRAAG